MDYQYSQEFARKLDSSDELSAFRNKFHIPEMNGAKVNYFTGNSLGLQPKNISDAINLELQKWQKKGVEGHFDTSLPWFEYHKYSKEALAAIVGARQEEVVLMNSLTVNLHLLMVSFYQPSSTRYKIIMEAGAFPSDQYAIETQVKYHGLNPDDAIIEVAPQPGEFLLREEDIIEAINSAGDQLALVIIGGVQYFSGQLFNMKSITAAGHKVGAYVGFDLAHAAGNVPLSLHDWDVDFAVWCSYKYLNAGPGNLSGAYVHEKHGNNKDLPRFAGWWGHNEEERFLMKKGFIPMAGADGWQLSNVNILAAAAVNASLAVFAETTMQSLRKKSILLTGFAEFLVNKIAGKNTDYGMEIITPSDPIERGCQLSIAVKTGGKQIFNKLTDLGVIADWREANLVADLPGIIRIAPVPLYNTYSDVYQLATKLESALKEYHG